MQHAVKLILAKIERQAMAAFACQAPGNVQRAHQMYAWDTEGTHRSVAEEVAAEEVAAVAATAAWVEGTSWAVAAAAVAAEEGVWEVAVAACRAAAEAATKRPGKRTCPCHHFERIAPGNTVRSIHSHRRGLHKH